MSIDEIMEQIERANYRHSDFPTVVVERETLRNILAAAAAKASATDQPDRRCECPDTYRAITPEEHIDTCPVVAEQPDELPQKLSDSLDAASQCAGKIDPDIDVVPLNMLDEIILPYLMRESDGEAEAWRNRCHAADRGYQELMGKYLARKEG